MAKRQNNIIKPMPWYTWLIVSNFMVTLGVCLMIIANHGVFFNYVQYHVGLIILIASIIPSILFIKALITEAHVKALEVFYGKERAIGSPYAEYDE
ncbi:MAG: hypothetical protein IKL95_01145 [Alphaproteobacteria bacterium]|nr:hypothetical protein [Alphaproteobacteria bacterium]